MSDVFIWIYSGMRGCEVNETFEGGAGCKILGTFGLGGCCLWLQDEPVRQFVLYKKYFGWMPGSWTQRNGIALALGLCDMGGHFGWWPPCLGGRSPFFQLYPGICLSWGKPRKVSVRVDCLCWALVVAYHFRGSLDWPAVH